MKLPPVLCKLCTFNKSICIIMLLYKPTKAISCNLYAVCHKDKVSMDKMKTWNGRLAYRADTFSAMALSILFAMARACCVASLIQACTLL